MSIRTMTAVWDSGRYDAGALLVLLAMADYADEEHVCRPSVGALARKARLSERQIIRILNGFKADGMITPIGEHRAKAGRPITIYHINVDALKVTQMSPSQPAKGDMMSPLEAAEGDICVSKGDIMSPLAAPKGDICAPKGDIAMSYDPPIEPPIEDNNNNTSLSLSSAPHSVVSVPAKPEPQPASPETLAYTDLCALYENNIGLITPIMAGTLRTALATFPAQWIEHAIALAVRNEKRRWSYVEGILLNWQREEFNANRTQQSANLPAARGQRQPGHRAATHSGGSGDPIAREQHATEWGPEWFEGINDELPPVDVVA